MTKQNELNKFTHSLNDLLKDANYSSHSNKLFNNLSHPLGLYVMKEHSEPNIYICSDLTSCNECIDDKLYENLLKLVQVDYEKSQSKKNKNKKTNRTTKKSTKRSNK